MSIFSIFKSLLGFWTRVLGASFSVVGVLSLSQRLDAISLPNLTSLLVDRYSLLRTDLFELVSNLISFKVPADVQDVILIVGVLGGLTASSFFTAVRNGYAVSVAQAGLVVIGGAFLFHYLVGPFLSWGLVGPLELNEYVDKFYATPLAMILDKFYFFAENLGAGSAVLTTTYLYIFIISSVLLLFPVCAFFGLFVIMYFYQMTQPRVFEEWTQNSEKLEILNQKFLDVFRFTASLWLHTLAFVSALVFLLISPF